MLNNTSNYREKGLSADPFAEFLRGFKEYEKGFLIKEKEDLLLDVYSQWLKSKEEKYKLRVMRIALELELLGVCIDIKRIFSGDIDAGTFIA